MTDLDKIKERIQALRAKTVENGCTEAEALGAAAKAQDLLSSYGLGEEELEISVYDEISIDLGKRRTPVCELWAIVAYYCNCTGWYTKSPEGLSWRYFGRSSDVLIAKYLHEILDRAILRAIREYKNTLSYQRRRKNSTRRAAVRAFTEGMVDRLSQKLCLLKWHRCDVGDPTKTGQLVKVYQSELEDELSRRGIQFQNIKSLKQHSNRNTATDRALGARAGNNVNLNQGITAAQGSDAVLLGANQ